MPARLTRIVLLLVVAGALVLAGAEERPLHPCRLSIYAGETGKRLCAIPVPDGSQVTLRYRHSSDGTPVRQVFAVDRGGYLRLLEESYAWYGAGLEFGSGFEFTFDSNEVTVRGYERIFDPLAVRVAGSVSQTVSVAGLELELASLAPPGSRLLFMVECD